MRRSSRMALLVALVTISAGCDLLFPRFQGGGGGATARPVPMPCEPGAVGDPSCVAGDQVFVSGRVRGPGGELVPNVTVRWELGDTAASSTDEGEPGAYRIGVPAGPVTLNWFAQGYLDVSHEVVLAPGQRLTLDVTLQRAP